MEHHWALGEVNKWKYAVEIIQLRVRPEGDGQERVETRGVSWDRRDPFLEAKRGESLSQGQRRDNAAGTRDEQKIKHSESSSGDYVHLSAAGRDPLLSFLNVINDRRPCLAAEGVPSQNGRRGRRLWRLSRARCTFFFVQGGSNIINVRRTCRYNHPATFGCRRGGRPKGGV